ncbi:MAG TPA: peptidoglycan-binding protein [Pyrinomonadaceae bacterium]|nr:peptidoglycan-binding protein [Pyrinomonadaceae bacterium]
MKLIPLVFVLFSFVLEPLASIRPAAAAGDIDPTDPTQYSKDWRPTGPPGGDVRDLVVDPNDPDRFYFGTLDGQIYTSADGGKRWELLYNFNKPKLFVDHILVDLRDSKILYAAAHRHKEPGGFFKSTDGGRTWRESKELKNEALHSLTQSESNPSVLIAGTFNGIFRSDDSGDTWRQLPTYNTPNLVHVESLAIDPRTPDIIYAGTWWLPFKSVDGGNTWNSIKNGIIDDSDIFAINIDPRDPNHVIASACSGIYETKNGGESWRKVQGIPSQSRRTRAILQHPSVPGLVFAGTTEGFWRSERGGDADSWMVTTSRQLEINSIAVHPSRPETVFIGTNNYGVMVSYDSGKSFLPTNAGYSGRFTNVIYADREMPNRVYAATINTATGGGFLFASNDNGQSWRPSMRNMPSRLITYAILQDTVDAKIIYLGTNLGIYRSIDMGVSWSPIWASEAPAESKKKSAAERGRKALSRKTRTAKQIRAVKTNKPDETVRRAQQALIRAGYNAGTADGKFGNQTLVALKRFQAERTLPPTDRFDEITLAALGVSTVKGSSSEEESGSSSLIITDAINALIHTVDEESGKPGFLAATNAGLYRSLDPTKGWQKLPYNGEFDARTTCISNSEDDPKVIWVGTAASGVLVSRDGGQTWRQVSGIPTDVPVNTVVQDPQRPDYVYVGTKVAFYASHDGGRTWSRRGGDLPFGDFTSILINPRNGDEILVGNAYQNGETGGGVYRSVNAGKTWTRIDANNGYRLPSFRIWSLAFDGHDQNTLFVGSHSAGVYVVPRRGVSIAESQ